MRSRITAPETYDARAAAAETVYVDQLVRQSGLDARQAVAYIDSRPLDDLPWGVRGRSYVRRMRERIQSAGCAGEAPPTPGTPH